jgi:hypothetical protein
VDFLSYPFIIAYPFIREVRVLWLKKEQPCFAFIPQKSCDFLMAEGLEMNQALIVNCLGNKKDSKTITIIITT